MRYIFIFTILASGLYAHGSCYNHNHYFGVLHWKHVVVLGVMFIGAVGSYFIYKKFFKVNN